MPDFTDEDKKTLVEDHLLLCGNGATGLCKRFEDCQTEEKEYRAKHDADEDVFRKSFFKFRLQVTAIVFFAAGTGSAAGVGVMKVLGG